MMIEFRALTLPHIVIAYKAVSWPAYLPVPVAGDSVRFGDDEFIVEARALDPDHNPQVVLYERHEGINDGDTFLAARWPDWEIR